MEMPPLQTQVENHKSSGYHKQGASPKAMPKQEMQGGGLGQKENQAGPT
jgi:hypothetical protein